MSRSRTALRIPRARIDPIDAPHLALALGDLALAAPPRAETIAFLLDGSFRGLGPIIVVSGTEDPDAVLHVADLMGELGACHDAFGEPADGLVIITARPDADLLSGDAERWRLASDVVDDHGVTLVEWFVQGRSGPACPRELFGDAPRWPGGHVAA